MCLSKNFLVAYTLAFLELLSSTKGLVQHVTLWETIASYGPTELNPV